MTLITREAAHRLVREAALPAFVRRSDAAPPAADDTRFAGAEPQAFVAGSALFAAGADVPAQTREDLANCLLFAQLAATGETPDPADLDAWHAAWFRWLSVLGWVQTAREFRACEFRGRRAATHEAILPVLASLLGPGAAALAVVRTALDALAELPDDARWITLFDRQSVVGRAARFQVATVHRDAAGWLQTGLVAFRLEARATLTRVLFFEFESRRVSLQHASGLATILESALAEQRLATRERLAAHRAQLLAEVTLPAPAPTRARRGERAGTGEHGTRRRAPRVTTVGVQLDPPSPPARRAVKRRRR